MKLLKGKKIADKILRSVRQRIKSEKLKPVLAVILVGKNEASEIYVKLKGKAAKKIGIGFQVFRFSEKNNQKKVLKKISKLNKDKKISGIIVQFPLPKKFNAQKIISSVDPKKDVDGFHPISTHKFINNQDSYWPVFPHAIIRLLETVPKSFLKPGFGKGALVLANSKKFGKVMIAALSKKNIKAGYILYKEIEKNLNTLKRADIIISAVGRPGLIKEDMAKKGAIIIDGGITKKGRKVLGDADFKSVKKTAGHLSPVPGGVGPVTIACLLENVYLAAKKQSR